MLRRVVPGVVVALLMLVLGALAVVDALMGHTLSHQARDWLLLLVVAAGCVAVSGRFPGLALAGVWVLLALHVVTRTPPVLPEIGVAYVGFACAAWGNRWTLVASLCSIPTGAGLVVLWFWRILDSDPWQVRELIGSWGLYDAARSALNSSWGAPVVLSLLALLLLTIPWLVGLAVRLRRRSDESRRSAEVAETSRADAEAQRAAAEHARDSAAEVARVRENQAQMARDVHDVVGHSLTVILAQAEAAQFRSDPDDLHRTLATIVDTARASLADVRQVLHATGSHPVVPAEADLHDLLAGVRAGGRAVDLVDVGQPRPLPPDRAPVAHRVLQEMLTNAVRHGTPSTPITVERHWAGDLRLEVTNQVGGPAPAGATLEETQPIHLEAARVRPETSVPEVPGHGLAGMRRRLEAVGGRLDCRRRTDPPTFTATAWIPLPGRLEHL